MTSFADLTVREFLRQLGAKQAAPGGGAAAALAAALAAAAAEMVQNYTEAKLDLPADAARSLVTRCLALADADAQAFGRVMDAYRLPKDDAAATAARQAALQEALRGAAEVPLELAERCLEIMRLASVLVDHGHRNVVSDAKVALILARAAFDASCLNVRVNLDLIKDQAYIQAVTARLEAASRLAAAWTDPLPTT